MPFPETTSGGWRNRQPPDVRAGPGTPLGERPLAAAKGGARGYRDPV